MDARLAIANGKGKCWECHDIIPKGRTQLIVLEHGTFHNYEHRMCLSCSILMLEREISKCQELKDKLMEVIA